MIAVYERKDVCYDPLGYPKIKGMSEDDYRQAHLILIKESVGDYTVIKNRNCAKIGNKITNFHFKTIMLVGRYVDMPS